MAMDTPPPSPAAARILQILRDRNGVSTLVTLHDGREFCVYDIVWGQDMGVPEYHITTNISPGPGPGPGPKAPHVIDFFSTGDVANIVDPVTRHVYFSAVAI
jgi:hypothetical protein